MTPTEQRLARRIHNQRVALRQNWEIVEMRAGYKHMPKEVRSRMLAGWGRAERRVRELERRVAELEAKLAESEREGLAMKIQDAIQAEIDDRMSAWPDGMTPQPVIRIPIERVLVDKELRVAYVTLADLKAAFAADVSEAAN